MSYLHCPSCKRAYNIAVQPACPFCPVHATVVDPAEDIVAAAEQLARAMARATPAERGAAATRMDRLALPAPRPAFDKAGFAAPLDDESARHRAPIMRQLRDVLDPLPPPPPSPKLLTTVARAVERGLASLEALWPRRSPKLLGDGLRRVRARVRALAAI